MSVLPAVLGTLLVVVPAFCASAGGEVDHKAQLWDFAWRLLNFAILVYILYKLAWKRLVSFFRNRREDIKTSLAEANDRKVEAEEKFKEYEVKLTKATDDIQNISEMI
ncbi:MAG TPA: ATP synthase F0 subunit B, partial [Syntrophales bacterium]|nr:ATP synthase F0 subunit B [Syntrophales bacterium]